MKDLERALTTESSQSYAQHDISLALASEVHPRLDARFGEGIVHRFGDDLASDLEVFPQAATVRLRTPELAIALAHQGPPHDVVEGEYGDGRVVFVNDGTTHRTTLIVNADGSGALVWANRPTPDELVELSVQAPPSAQRAPWEDDPEQNRLDRGERGQPLSGRGGIDAKTKRHSGASPEPATEPTAEKNGRLKLSGQVMAEPNFHETSRGVPRILFPLQTGEATHVVYATKDFALNIRDLELQPGEDVRVTGARHHYAVQNGDGGVEEQERVYAWSVKRNTTGY